MFEIVMGNPLCLMYVFRVQALVYDTDNFKGMVELIKKDADKSLDDLF